MAAEAAMHFCIRCAKARDSGLGMKEQTCSIYWGGFLQMKIIVLDNHDIYSSALLILYLHLNLKKCTLFITSSDKGKHPSKGFRFFPTLCEEKANNWNPVLLLCYLKD